MFSFGDILDELDDISASHEQQNSRAYLPQYIIDKANFDFNHNYNGILNTYEIKLTSYKDDSVKPVIKFFIHNKNYTFTHNHDGGGCWICDGYPTTRCDYHRILVDYVSDVYQELRKIAFVGTMMIQKRQYNIARTNVENTSEYYYTFTIL